MKNHPNTPPASRGSVKEASSESLGDTLTQADENAEVKAAQRGRQRDLREWRDGLRTSRPEQKPIYANRPGMANVGEVKALAAATTKGRVDSDATIAGRAIVSIDACDACPDVIKAMLGAFAVGDAFVGIYDDADYLRYANGSFLRVFGLEAGTEATFTSIVLQSHRAKKGVRIEASDPRSFVIDAQMRRRILARAPRQRSFAVDFTDDRWFWCTETLLESGWIVLSGSNITELKQAQRILETSRDQALHLSRVDELTGVANRRFALSRLDKLMHRAALARARLTAAILDLDHFKSINDTFGHEAGDSALVHFARHCASCLRPTDLMGRLGGEEFILVLPETSPETAKDFLEGILASIPEIVVCDGSQSLRLTFSAGVTSLLENDRREHLLARADQALYAAKASGREQVRVV